MVYVETSFLWFLLEVNTLKPVIIYILKYDYSQLLIEKDFKMKRFQHDMLPEGLNYHPQNFLFFYLTLLIQIKVILFFVVR